MNLVIILLDDILVLSTFLISLKRKFGQEVFFSLFKIFFELLNCSMFCFIFFCFKIPNPEALRSLAIPKTPAQSTLLGVIAISNSIFSSLMYSEKFSPTI